MLRFLDRLAVWWVAVRLDFVLPAASERAVELEERVEQLDEPRLDNLHLAQEQAVLVRKAKARSVRLKEAIEQALPFSREMEQWASKVRRRLQREVGDAETDR